MHASLYYLILSSPIYSLCRRLDFLGTGLYSGRGNSRGGDAENRLLRFNMFFDIPVH